MSQWENFKVEEFACKHCGENKIKPELIDVVQKIRTALGRPIRISSGYRCEDHPAEKRKDEPGEHFDGTAADLAVSYENAFLVLRAALSIPEVTGIGVNQKGPNRFIHIGIGPAKEGRPRPHVWSY